ncbi:hypothetical protein [Mucilaginibacter glaciei]|uniref:Uncharacterized protein n=1 Tax=Mucilaginibacter glaciei TaxID=2772109 RepID=A0A926S1I9_9SPHI|nr:hypothetical protein [Mucilaginibacter glaciei]MBD1394090.1 hypothetical protein [Mucilaginibacter glaciei]
MILNTSPPLPQTRTLAVTGDIQKIYEIFNTGKMNDVKTFTGNVVTAYGTQYILKGTNPTQFSTFGNQNLSDATKFSGFLDRYDTNRIDFSTTNIIQLLLN